MQICVYENSKKVAQAAAMIFASELLKKPDCVLGLATGSTPVETYQELIRLNREGLIDFSKVRSYNLDEYVGLAPTHPCSYRYFMQQQLFDHINILPENTHVPSGVAGDLAAGAAAYDEAIRQAGGIDLQLLGIGHNGHIGFNEPLDSEFIYGTHVVTLTESTLQANSINFEDPADMPRQAVSLGMGGILSAKRIILLALGSGKAPAIRDTVRGEISSKVPASLLKVHPNVTLLLDREAAALL